MSSPVATAPGITHTEAPAAATSRLVLAFVLMVANGSLARTGQRVLILEGETVIIGRHDPARSTELAHFAEHQPGMPMPPPSPAGGLPCPTLSHEHLRVTARKDGLWVKVIGTRPTQLNGQPFKEGLVSGGDTIMFVGEALLLCIWTPMELPTLPAGVPLHSFGKADLVGIRGESAVIWELRRLIRFAASTQQDVLVIGESGAGKTAVAEAIHYVSSRKDGPIVKRTCTQFTENLLESQLFGTRKGLIGSGKESFDGIFPAAEGGTIILDEIGLAPLWLQKALLTVLEEGVYTVVGAARVSTVDVRIVGTTNADPKEAFREDFDARLAILVVVPPVREHRDDIGFMLRAFLEEADATMTLDPPSKRRISPTFVDYLVRHPLPTNARQIRNIMFAALAMNTPGHVKLPASLLEGAPPSKQPASVTRASVPPVSRPRESTAGEEKPGGEKAGGASRGGRPKAEPLRSEAEVLAALEKSGGDKTKAAVELGLSRAQLLRLIEKLGL